MTVVADTSWTMGLSAFICIRATASSLCVQFHQVTDVPLDCCQRSVRPFLIDVRLTQQADAELQRAERLSPLMCGHPRELFKPLVLFGNRLRVQRDERFNRRLRQHIDRLIQPEDERHTLRRRGHGTESFHLFEHEGDEHAPEQLVLAEHLM